MSVVTPQVNLIILNKGADLIFDGHHVWVPMGHSSTKDLAGNLDARGADVITVEYTTVSDPVGRERDRQVYTRRLRGLEGAWEVSPWVSKIVRGFVLELIMQCTLTRKKV